MLNSEKKNCCNLFSFHKLNKYFLLPFFIPIICFTTKFFSERMKTDGNKIKVKDISFDNTITFAFLYQIIQSISLILGGLIFFVTLCKIKSRKNLYINNESDKDSSSSNSLKNDKIKNKLRRIYLKDNKVEVKQVLITIFMPLLFIIYNFGIAFGVGYPQLEKRVYFLFFITLINIFIFKKQIFRHQKLALVITLIGIFPIYLSFGLYFDTESYFIIYDIFLFIGAFCYSVFLVIIKYLTLNKEMSVFLLLFFQGILSFIYTILVYISISLIVKGDFTYIFNIFECSDINHICISYYYLKIIMYLFLNTILQALIFVVVYHFSPELFAISDIWSPLFSFIAYCIEFEEKNCVKIFLNVLGYLIIAFGAFIYNEIIVCNFCGLNENTWKAIYDKAIDELRIRNTKEYLSIDDNYLIKDNDDYFINIEENFSEFSSLND